jgi:DNA mismatch repair protein MutS
VRRRRAAARLFGVGTLDAFGSFARAELSAMGALVDYLDLTQKGRAAAAAPARCARRGRAMQIDAATRRNLELTQALSGGRDGSLLAAIDRTVTAAGARLLERRLASALAELAADRAPGWMRCRFCVEERAAARACATPAPHARHGPRAVAAGARPRRAARPRRDPRRAGGGAPRSPLRAGAARTCPPAAEAANRARSGFDALALLDAALVAEPPLRLRDGGVHRPGARRRPRRGAAPARRGPRRDRRDAGDYARETGVAALKIKHNNVLGYFIETTATHAEKMLSPPLSSASSTARRRPTRALHHVELSDLESRILNAGARALEIERRLFESLRDASWPRPRASPPPRGAGRDRRRRALADLADSEDWCRPKVDDSRAFAIEGGRHPVVEQALRRGAASPSSPTIATWTADRTARAIWLLTGPNMAGKSTFLRQNALIALLAQMGSFVPAAARRISAWWTSSSAASARRTTWRAGGRPSWSRWSRPPRS